MLVLGEHIDKPGSHLRSLANSRRMCKPVDQRDGTGQTARRAEAAERLINGRSLSVGMCVCACSRRSQLRGLERSKRRVFKTHEALKGGKGGCERTGQRAGDTPRSLALGRRLAKGKGPSTCSCPLLRRWESRCESQHASTGKEGPSCGLHHHLTHGHLSTLHNHVPAISCVASDHGRPQCHPVPVTSALQLYIQLPRRPDNPGPGSGQSICATSRGWHIIYTA